MVQRVHSSGHIWVTTGTLKDEKIVLWTDVYNTILKKCVVRKNSQHILKKLCRGQMCATHF